jgi:hypothetical protein
MMLGAVSFMSILVREELAGENCIIKTKKAFHLPKWVKNGKT